MALQTPDQRAPRHSNAQRGGDQDAHDLKPEVGDERRPADDAQAERDRARLAAIVSSADDAIVSATLDGFVTSWNRGAEHIYGYTTAEMIGTSLDVLAPPDRTGEFVRLVEDVLRGETVQGYETQRVKRDGQTIEISLSISLVRLEDGQLVGVSAIGHDITVRKQAERDRHELERRLQETQKLESLGVMAAGIAHDFNNLLVGVLGNAGIALTVLPPGSPAHEAVADIESAAVRMAELTRQILIYAGKSRQLIEPVSLPHVVEGMAGLLRGPVASKASLRFTFERDVPLVAADAAQLRQVVLSLITNASEAIGDDGGVITVSAGSVLADQDMLSGYDLAEELPPGRYAYLDVSDTGPGMEPSVKWRIFEPFFTTKFIGRGLGLSAVRGIVRGHRGAIRVDSEPGVGSSFRILLPAVE